MRASSTETSSAISHQMPIGGRRRAGERIENRLLDQPERDQRRSEIDELRDAVKHEGPGPVANLAPVQRQRRSWCSPVRGLCVGHARTSSRPVRSSCAKREFGVGGQLRARAVLDDVAVLQDQDVVGALHGAEPVRDDDAVRFWNSRSIARSSSRSVAGSSRDEASSRITRPGSCRKHAREGQQLRLPGRQPDAAGAEQAYPARPAATGTNPTGPISRSTLRIGLVGDAPVEERQVVADAGLEQLHILRDHADCARAGLRG